MTRSTVQTLPLADASDTPEVDPESPSDASAAHTPLPGDIHLEARTSDRRTAPTATRLKTGIWLEFHRRTGLGTLEPIQHLGSNLKAALLEATIAEGVRFRFSEKHTDAPANAQEVAQRTVDPACAEWRALRPYDRQAGTLADLVTDRILAIFDAQQIDRRGQSPRIRQAD